MSGEIAQRKFAALRFAEDPNLSDRVYWYACDFPVRAGEAVLAPVGAHDGLQCAVVERTLLADDAHAPYDVRLIKWVCAPLGARKAVFSSYVCRDVGGVRYDGKRYIRLHVFFSAQTAPDGAALRELAAYGIGVYALADEAGDLLRLSEGDGPLLFWGERAPAIEAVLHALARGEDEAVRRLAACGLSAEQIRRLARKLR